MKQHRRSALLAPGLALALALGFGCGKGDALAGTRRVRVSRGEIQEVVQAAGQVNPLNKVSIIPPVTGRIDSIVLDEGARVRKGEVLAWMSSSDRAAILDNARAEGPAVLERWEREYRSTPIVAPTDGTIISRNVVAGQTVDGSTDMYDLSDRLVVYASVDETDLAKIHMGQLAECTVEAYPDRVFDAHVTLIGHQAVKVDNVVSYQVTLLPDKVPGRLRAGMTANVNFIVLTKKDVLWLPSFAVRGASDGPATVEVLGPDGKTPQTRSVQLGITDGIKVEVVAGLTEGDTVLIPSLDLGDGDAGGLALGFHGHAAQKGGHGGGH